MAQKKNKNKQSGQLARSSQNNANFAPVASARSNRTSAPTIKSTNKMTHIVHRELVTTINGNTTFGVSTFNLNPGLSATFPWLSSIAGSFEQYRFNRVTFKYITRAPTSYIGSILMAPEYDALDAAPSSELLASQMNGAIEDTPWKDQSLSFVVGDMFPMGPRKYIRTGTLPSSSDMKTYDAGQLFVCAVSCFDTSAIGKLWVEYDVELHIPQNPSAGSLYNVGSALSFVRSSSQSLTTATYATVDWNDEVLNDIGASNASGVISLLPGTYVGSGVISYISDDTSGSIAGVVIVYHNGSPISNYNVSRIDTKDSTNADHAFPLPYAFSIVSASSSDTLEVKIRVTSSGTLTLSGTQCILNLVRTG
jgi:hypothetical protein